MTLPEYITATRSTDLVNTVKHAALGLLSEIGEVYGILARIERGDNINRAERMTAELGDVAWYLARLWDLAQLPPTRVRVNDNPLVSPYTFSAYCQALTHNAVWAIHHENALRALPLGYSNACFDWSCWYQLCAIENLDPATVLQTNLAKLRDRAARRVLQGDGDHR